MFKYTVLKDQRKVIAVFTGADEDAFKYINKRLPDYLKMGRCPDELKMPFKFTGVAKCDPNDEWDEELGKVIAENRALIKYYNTIVTIYANYVEAITGSTKKVVEQVSNCADQLDGVCNSQLMTELLIRAGEEGYTPEEIMKLLSEAIAESKETDKGFGEE